MPLYEYKCVKCAQRTEKIEKHDGPRLKKCPKCGGKVEPLVSSPSFQFKGSGWYVTDYARKSSSGGSDESSKSDSNANSDSGKSESKESKESKDSKDSKDSKETKSKDTKESSSAKDSKKSSSSSSKK